MTSKQIVLDTQYKVARSLVLGSLPFSEFELQEQYAERIDWFAGVDVAQQRFEVFGRLAVRRAKSVRAGH